MDQHDASSSEAELTSEERNKLLLNALKNKQKTNQNSNKHQQQLPVLALPKLKLPLLKTSVHIKSNDKEETNLSTASLNNFLIQQLQKKLNGEKLEGKRLVIPKISTNDFEIPQLQSVNAILPAPQESIHEVTNVLKKLSVESDKVDLTSALSTNTNHMETPNKRSCHFPVPSAGNDATELKSTQLLNIDENCLVDWSTVELNHYFVEASSLGQHICHKFETRPLPKIEYTYKTKFHIEPFDFSTASPDDKVLASLQRYKREYL